VYFYLLDLLSPMVVREPATITLALLRAMGHLPVWDALLVDDRYLRQLANH